MHRMAQMARPEPAWRRACLRCRSCPSPVAHAPPPSQSERCTLRLGSTHFGTRHGTHKGLALLRVQHSRKQKGQAPAPVAVVPQSRDSAVFQCCSMARWSPRVGQQSSCRAGRLVFSPVPKFVICARISLFVKTPSPETSGWPHHAMRPLSLTPNLPYRLYAPTGSTEFECPKTAIRWPVPDTATTDRSLS